jgi:hypothetical protein
MISNAAYFQKLNKSHKAVKEGSAKMVAQFRIEVVPHISDIKGKIKKSKVIPVTGRESP